MASPRVPEELLGKPVVSAEQIAHKVAELGREIAADHGGEDLRLVTVLRGGVFFLADLCRAVDAPLTLDFMAISSFASGAAGGVRITKDLDDSIEGAAVVVVEDIIDTGLTLNYILKVLRARNPASLSVCTLLDKDVRRIVDLPVAYLGFQVPDRFLVGYGLDYRGCYRNLPYVAALRDDSLR